MWAVNCKTRHLFSCFTIQNSEIRPFPMPAAKSPLWWNCCLFLWVLLEPFYRMLSGRLGLHMEQTQSPQQSPLLLVPACCIQITLPHPSNKSWLHPHRAYPRVDAAHLDTRWVSVVSFSSAPSDQSLCLHQGWAIGGVRRRSCSSVSSLSCCRVFLTEVSKTVACKMLVNSHPC